jgi:hypothetical protein
LELFQTTRRLGRAWRLQLGPSMAVSVALLTLLLPAATQAGLSLAHTVERFPLEGNARGVVVRAEPIGGRIVVEGPDVAALARQLRSPKRKLCPDVSIREGAVVLRCPTQNFSAALVPHAGGFSLQVSLLRVSPWAGRDGLPIVPVDPFHFDLGAGCPGDTPAGQGECALAAGQLHRALGYFRKETGEPGLSLAALRIGDIAARTGDLAEAVSSWRKVAPRSPFGRLAAARLCETEPNCLPTGRSSILYDTSNVAEALRPDLVLRRARVEAFGGRALEGAQLLLGEYEAGGACTAEPLLCGDILLEALQQPGARGTQALAVYLHTPSRDRGPQAIELARAAADRSLASGAPIFAATLLSVVSSAVPRDQLSSHLARTTELFLEGGDTIRATVVLEFARSRLSRAELGTPRWSRLAASATRPPEARAPAAKPSKEGFPGLEADLADANRALAASRAAVPGSPP